MNNFQAIKKMDEEAMAEFLDQVYLAGLNTGTYYAGHPEEEELIDDNPFAVSWLHSDAEKATLNERASDGDGYLLEALALAALRGAGLEAEAHSSIPQDV